MKTSYAECFVLAEGRTSNPKGFCVRRSLVPVLKNQTSVYKLETKTDNRVHITVIAKLALAMPLIQA